MRILNLKQFRELPEGAVFMKYEPCIFEVLSVKGETWEVDFLYGDLATEIKAGSSDEEAEILDNAEKDSSLSVGLDLDSLGRDGCFDNEQLFAVYEQKDIDNLIEKLKGCKGI